MVPLTDRELWEHYYQIALVDLGMTDEQFWGTTPKRLSILMERKQVYLQREGRLTGIIAAAVANFSMCRGETWLKPSDFVSGLPEAEQDLERNTDTSPEAVRLNFMKAFNQPPREVLRRG